VYVSVFIRYGTLVHGYKRYKFSTCFAKCTDIFMYYNIKFHITWILMIGWPCIVVEPWSISNLMHKNSYLFIYNIFIKILCIFRALPCSSSGGLRRNCIYAVSGIVTLCRWLSHLQRLTIPEAAYIYNYDVDLLKLSRVMLETCRGV